MDDHIKEMGRACSMDGKYKKFGKYSDRETKKKMSLVDLGINGNVGTMDLSSFIPKVMVLVCEKRGGTGF
jgi:hypothetical protein